MHYPSFTYCPACSAEALIFEEGKRFSCSSCGWILYLNAGAAVGAILTHQQNLILVRRNRDPAKGLLDIVGGFVDPGENLEEALAREIKEEVLIDIHEFSYFSSFSNIYPFAGNTYTTCDIIFTAEVTKVPTMWCKNEVSEIIVVAPDQLQMEEIGFNSIRKALTAYCSTVTGMPTSRLP